MADGYQMANGRWADTKSGVFAASAARTANGSATIEMGDRSTLRLDLAVTAISGSGATLAAFVYTSKDNGIADPYRLIATLPQFTATGALRTCIAGCDRLVKVSWEITGSSPSITFSASGEAV
jgi:hypothetical protein